MTEERFDPWLAAELHDDLILALDPVAALMGGGFHAWRGGLGVIVVDPALAGADRRAVLTHELVHHERGGAVERVDAPAAWQSMVDREERAVDREVARRLVPSAELWALITERVADGGGVDAAEVAAHFDVPRWVAVLAADRFTTEQPDRNPS
jgi:hypothetical protein